RCIRERVVVMTQEILSRENDERETYMRVGTTGRSARSDDALRIPEATICRYRSVAERNRARYALEQMVAWSSPLAGKQVLEICCHDAEYGTILARLGASVDAVDIAPPLIEQACRRAA